MIFSENRCPLFRIMLQPRSLPLHGGGRHAIAPRITDSHSSLSVNALPRRKPLRFARPRGIKAAATQK